MKLSLPRLVLLAICLSLLTACAGTYRAYIDTLSYAFSPPSDAELTLEQVRASASDLLYVRNGERPQAVMALAYIERGQQKWLSADKALLVLANGRIVRTSGFSHDLLYTSNLEADPLKLAVPELNRAQWRRLTDWQQGEYGYLIESDFIVGERELLTIEQQTVMTIKVTERARMETQSHFLRFDGEWQNEYWFAADSGLLLKTRQQVAPYAELMELLFISRFARSVAKQASAGVAAGPDKLTTHSKEFAMTERVITEREARL